MKKRTFSCIVMIVFLVVVASVNAYADSGDVEEISTLIDLNEENAVNAEVQYFYNTSVVDSIIKHKEELIKSDVTDEMLKNAEVSQGIPVYSTQVEKLEVGDFKDQLSLCQWMFLVYISDEPVATFFANINGNGLILENIMGEEFSKAVYTAIERVKSERLIAFTIRLNYYIANEQDEVAIVDMNNTIDEVVSFDEVETAVDQSIEYYEGRPDDEVGGDYTIEYLYGNVKNEEKVGHYYIFIIIGIAFFVAFIGLAFKIWKSIANRR